MDKVIEYHSRELQIALDPESRHHVMPRFADSDNIVLDIGCGIGQTLAASGQKVSQVLVGVDTDLQSVRYGHQQFGCIEFVNGSAEFLPFKNETFDLVICRLSLPYTNIPVALIEIRRVLKKEGRVWFALHSFGLVMRNLTRALRRLHFKSVAFQIYTVVNGVYFHLVGKLLIFPVNKRRESFQTKSRIIKAMKRSGYGNIVAKKEKHFTVSANRGRSDIAG